MNMEIIGDKLFINGKHFCQCEIRSELESNTYKIMAISHNGETLPMLYGKSCVIHGDSEKQDGILVGEFICDGVAVGSRAKIARIVRDVMLCVDSGKNAVLEIAG